MFYFNIKLEPHLKCNYAVSYEFGKLRGARSNVVAHIFKNKKREVVINITYMIDYIENYISFI